MNNKLVLFLLLIFLILLLLFYYLQIQSNIIILLGVVIILLINDLIVNREHFNTETNLDNLLSRVDGTLQNLEKLKQTVKENTEEEQIPYLEVNSSCAPFNSVSGEISDNSEDPLSFDTLQGIKVPNLDNDGVPLSIESSELLSGITE
jgi:hypothetical protein